MRDSRSSMAALVLYPFLRKHCSSRNVNSVALVCFALVFIGVGLSGTSLATSYWTQWTLPSKIVTSSHHSGLGCLCCRGTIRKGRFTRILLHPRLFGCRCIHCRSRYFLVRESSPQQGRLLRSTGLMTLPFLRLLFVC